MTSILLVALAFTVPASAAVPEAPSSERHPILVTAVAGDVDVSIANVNVQRRVNVQPRVDVQPRVGDEVLLPARIATGADGTLSLEQSRTSISIAPDSEIEIPQAASDGQLVARLVQWRGNVFYDVETRQVERLTVETPYLVAVVKGTQFNVAVLDDTTTISLFEGRLEIRDPDGRNVVDLEAGEVAIRSSTDETIRIIDMSVAELPTVGRNGTLVAAGDRRATGGSLTNGASAALLPAGALRVDAPAAQNSADLGFRIDAALGAEVALTDPALAAVNDSRGVETALGTIALDAGLGADLGSSADLGVGADLSASATLDGGSFAADLGLGADLGNASLATDLGASLDLDGGTADLGLGAAADLGGATIGADLGAGLDLGGGTADLGLGADASMPGLELDASADLGIAGSLADGSLDASLGADLGLGDVGIGADLGAELDAGGGTLAGDLDTGIDLGGTGLDAGLDADVDLAGGDVSSGLELGGLVDAGLDAGLDLGGDDAGLDAGVTLPGGIDATLDVDLDLGGGGDDDGGLLGIVDVDLGGGGGSGGLLGGLL
jgi:hypothetical protein